MKIFTFSKKIKHGNIILVTIAICTVVAFTIPKTSTTSYHNAALKNDPGGQNSRVAGAPGDANGGFNPATCASCHANQFNGGPSAGNDNIDGGSVALTFPALLTPGVQQTGTINLKLPSNASVGGGGGFQLIATNGTITSNVQYGTFANISGQGTKIFTSVATNGRLSHSTGKALPTVNGFRQATWNFNYTAPVGSTVVKFYLTGHGGAGGGQDGNTYASTFTSSLVPVPVKFTQFTATNIRNAVKLNWTIENEININHYEAEVSTDGINFTKLDNISTLQSVGTSKNYSYTDNTDYLNVKTVYYRIKSVDNDANTNYTSVVTIKKVAVNKSNFSINPTMTSGSVNIRFNEVAADNALITVTDISGKTVITKNEYISKGLNTIRLDLSGLIAGIYYVKISAGQNVFIKSVIKN